MEPISVFFILIPIGLAVGIFAAITGLGGGVLMVPILFLGIFAFYDPSVDDAIKYATTISSTVIIFTALSGTIAFSIQKRIDYIVGLLCAPFTIAGAYLGKFTQSKIDESVVLIFFAILLILTAGRMLYKIINTKRKDRLVNETISIENENQITSILNEEEPSRFKLLLDKLTLNRTITDRENKEWNYKARLYLTPIA
ncbi:MAG: sulfite exporter TauE/SafE family protein, partial [Asgard group archaeon]|nr:sulfite exporter TauE/SafE family protein [Asgard group archaeon]